MDVADVSAPHISGLSTRHCTLICGLDKVSGFSKTGVYDTIILVFGPMMPCRVGFDNDAVADMMPSAVSTLYSSFCRQTIPVLLK
jgi:hypothetical protein